MLLQKTKNKGRTASRMHAPSAQPQDHNKQAEVLPLLLPRIPPARALTRTK